MQFSKRMDGLAPYLFATIEKKIQEKRKAGIDVISLGMGDPDIATPDYIVEEMKRQVADARNHRYPTNAGLEVFAEAAAAFYKRRFGVDIDPATEFFPLLGCKEGLAHVILATADPGDVVLVPDPGYPVYYAGTIISGATPLIMPLKAENDFLPDLDAISAEDRRKAKLMFVSYPNNPTAAVVPEGSDFYERVAAFGRDNGLAVVSDNAYSELTFDGYVAPSFLQSPGAKEAGVELFSFSKPFNMTGWRIGFAVGNKDILAALWKLKTNMDSGMFEALQRTAAFILNGSWDFVDEMMAVYARRRDLVLHALSAIGLHAPQPQATIYMWVPVPEGYTSASFAEKVLDEAAVVVTPGNGYGTYGEGFVRISLTAPDERIEEAVARIEKSLKL
ncbi:MAG: LL-diaminopimelate aminotransferase [Gaiellales bacterium]|nr:LL-diaminopimelate aminotransferase [Gaiellales bacterium]